MVDAEPQHALAACDMGRWQGRSLDEVAAAEAEAMALTLGSYVWPGQAHAVAVAAVVALTAVNYAGVQKSALLTRGIVAVVLAVLAAVVVASLTSEAVDASRLDVGSDATFGGVLQAAGLLFFAFAGYARIATLGEEVRDPARTIPRAILIALGITLVAYATVAVSVLLVLGPDGLAAAGAPLTEGELRVAPENTIARPAPESRRNRRATPFPAKAMTTRKAKEKGITAATSPKLPPSLGT